MKMSSDKNLNGYFNSLKLKFKSDLNLTYVLSKPEKSGVKIKGQVQSSRDQVI